MPSRGLSCCHCFRNFRMDKPAAVLSHQSYRYLGGRGQYSGPNFLAPDAGKVSFDIRVAQHSELQFFLFGGVKRRLQVFLYPIRTTTITTPSRQKFTRSLAGDIRSWLTTRGPKGSTTTRTTLPWTREWDTVPTASTKGTDL